MNCREMLSLAVVTQPNTFYAINIVFVLHLFKPLSFSWASSFSLPHLVWDSDSLPIPLYLSLYLCIPLFIYFYIRERKIIPIDKFSRIRVACCKIRHLTVNHKYIFTYHASKTGAQSVLLTSAFIWMRAFQETIFRSAKLHPEIDSCHLYRIITIVNVFSILLKPRASEQVVLTSRWKELFGFFNIKDVLQK